MGQGCPPHYTGKDAEIIHSIVTEGCEIEGHVENSVLSPSVRVGKGAKVLYSVLMPGATVEPGAVVEYAIVGENSTIKAGATVEYAIIGENCVIEAGAKVGSVPDGSEGWGVATCGPDVTSPAGAVVPAAAMIYSGEEV